MSDPRLSNIGNVSESYEHIPRVALFSSCFWHPKACSSDPSVPVELVLKEYLMPSQEAQISPKLVLGLDAFLRKELEDEIIEKRMGFGFLILSQLGEKAFLNVQVFGNDDVLFPSLYVSEDATILGFFKKATEYAGSSCIWEAQIIAFESTLWGEFLSGELTKLEYLSRFYEGPL